MAKANKESIDASVENVKDENASLADYSEHGSVWNVHKAQADAVMSIYKTVKRFERYALRINQCSGVLRFGWVVDNETGEVSFKLHDAYFCRVRHCPICQWRRSLMWQSKFYKVLPEIQQQYPSARWLFLTLTVRNCGVSDLGSQLRLMGEAWRKLVRRKELSNVLGWVRTTEITRGKNGSAHPHFHVLLMVNPSMLSKNYIKQSKWVEIWQQSAKLDYAPMVDIRTVKPKKGQSTHDALGGAIAETLKYAVKPSDMVADKEWFLEMTKQVHKRRFIASGGVLKDVLNFCDTEYQNNECDKKLAFNWWQHEKEYKRYPIADD